MIISEPTTMVTDYVLATVCLYGVYQLIARPASRGPRRIKLWLGSMLTGAVAATAGGTSHGFRVPLGEWWAPLWNLTLMFIAVSVVFFVAASVSSLKWSEAHDEHARRHGVRWFLWGCGFTLAGGLVLASRLTFHEHFNQNDLFHLLQAVGVYLIYRAILHLHNLG